MGETVYTMCAIVTVQRGGGNKFISRRTARGTAESVLRLNG